MLVEIAVSAGVSVCFTNKVDRTWLSLAAWPLMKATTLTGITCPELRLDSETRGAFYGKVMVWLGVLDMTSNLGMKRAVLCTGRDIVMVSSSSTALTTECFVYISSLLRKI